MLPNMTDTMIAQNRFGLGWKRGQQRIGDPQVWLRNQLAAFNPRPSTLTARPSSKAALATLQEYRAFQRSARRMRNESGDNANPGLQEQRRTMRQSMRRDYFEDAAARAQTAAASDTPFAERLVHFWSNHFAVSAQKNIVRSLAGPYEFDAVRPNIMGSFADLLKASVLHPAMLVYLDQAQSVGPQSRAAVRRRERGGREAGLNENLAREILELHTLGVRSGYSQTDVTEFARALTGWTVTGQRSGRDIIELPNGSAFAGRLHEPGARTILGENYSAEGPRQALSILDTLAAHPATAKHIATKLARHFTSDDPPPSLVTKLKTVFLETNGDLPRLYSALIAAPEVWTTDHRKFRQPWDWSIAVFRMVGTDGVSARNFNRLMTELGQSVWAPASPAGYDDTMRSWAAPDALIRRVEASGQLAARYRSDDVIALAQQAFGDALNDDTATAIRRAESPKQGLALLLASPEMMWR